MLWALAKRVKCRTFPACFNLRRLIVRSKFSALIHRLKFPALSNRLDLSDLIDRLRVSGLIDRIKPLFFRRINSNISTETSVQPDLTTLNCRVRLTGKEMHRPASTVFEVEICGSVYTPDDKHETTLEVTIADVTDAMPGPSSVQAKVKQWQMPDSTIFRYDADLGKLSGRATTLSNWTTVARLRVDWLLFPRKGKRDLKFRTSISSRQTGQELARAECTYAYENANPGYVDLEEDRSRTKTLAVALAFAVSASDNKLFNCEVELIKNWARNNVHLSQASGRARRKLEKALNKSVAFFGHGNRLNTYEICKEIVGIAPIADRHGILDLCLHVAQAKGSVAPEELAILADLAAWLEVDIDAFRNKMERILPINMHQIKDAETVLGVTSDMSKDTARHHLNKEYSKWNARVTNSDPQIQAQADQMLSLIAEARHQYVS